MGKFEEFRENPPSIATVRKIIWLSGISRKRTTKSRLDRNLEYQKTQRKNASLAIVNDMMNNKEIIYIDETGFNKDFIPRYGFSVKNYACYVPALTKSKNFSCIVALSKEGVIGLQIFEGSVKSGDFGCFILNLIRNSVKIDFEVNNYVFFLDNASIHHAECLSNLKNYINFRYNAPYSPFLNPIEECFGLVKNNFRKLLIKNNLSFFNNLFESFKSLNVSNIEGFIIHSLEYLYKCIKSIDI